MNSTSSTIPQSPRSHSSQPTGGRRPTRTAVSVSSSYMQSDCGGPDSATEQNNTTSTTAGSPSLGQRSVSLTTLQPAVIQPRMAQLETLEAKMASIEVSLSSTPRRKKNGSLNGLNLGSSIRINKELAVKELENLRSALRDKENIIQNLKDQLTLPIRLNGTNTTTSNNRELSANEKKQAEDRIHRLKLDVDNKRLAIKNLKIALERLDITEKNFSNIDIRIQQAELEYQLGREELNLLSLLEEIRTLQICLEESNKNSTESHTLFNSVNNNGYFILQALEVNYDPKSPKFVAGQKDSTPGLWVDWALEETGMCKGDRLIEVNGKIVLTKTLEDLNRLLAAAPDPAQIVLLRKLSPNEKAPLPLNNNASKEVAALRSELEVVKERAEEAQRAKDGLRSDNIRLTHRISYLEEQVSELLSRRSVPTESDIRIVTPTPVISTVKTNQNVTNINITSNPPNGTNCNDLQVFQKGSQITTLIPSNFEPKESTVSLPIRSKSSMSNVSNTHISAVSSQNGDFHCHRSHRHKHHRTPRNSIHSSLSNQNLDQTNDKLICRKHHHHREKDYNSETNSSVDHVARYNKRNSGYTEYTNGKTNSEKDYGSDVMDQSYKKATKIVHELTRSRQIPTLYEKHRQKCITASEKYDSDILKHYNARKSTSVLDFRSEVHIGSNKYVDSKSAEDLDTIDKHSKSVSRLYKKIQDARSVKSLDFDSDCNSTATSCRTNGHTKSVDYTSEPIENKKITHYYHGEHAKPRPTPPKKPLRLSLHKTQSLQSVDTPPITPHDSPTKINESRKSLKRNHKGEIPVSLTVKSFEQNGEINGHSGMKWMHFNKHIDSSAIEKGSWC